jgi:hypothetical protein
VSGPPLFLRVCRKQAKARITFCLVEFFCLVES